VFLQLVRSLTGAGPVLRIGGDSADWTWWPVPGIRRPPGVTFTITPRWVAVTRRLTAALGARLILGINLEANSTDLAAAEAQTLIASLGQGSIRALELGNEPELYGAFPWYRTGGKPVTGRPSSYDFTAFLQDFTRFAAVLPRVPLAGPTVSGPRWMQDLGRFMAAEPQAKVVTLHRYPLQLCYMPRDSPRYPSVAHLLSSQASSGLAGTFAPYTTLVHRAGRELRIDELNTVSCGADPAVSQTFASALWALDTLFAMVDSGIDGVNIHTFPGAGYELFTFRHASGRWSATVSPEYYGLLMFAQAAPPGSRLLPVTAGSGSLKVWATRAPDGRVRIVAINKDAAHERVVTLRVPGGRSAGLLERLEAPSVSSRSGVSLGGWSFGARTRTGVPAPRMEAVTASGGRFEVALAPGSAALLTVGAGR
jgi:hypothetical protein